MPVSSQMKMPVQRMNIEYQGFRKKLQWYWLCARLTIVLVLKIKSQPQ
jgi:hypothetical protein